MMSMNSAYIDELYFEYLRDPDSVSQEWRAYFENYEPASAPPKDVATKKRDSVREHRPSNGPNRPQTTPAVQAGATKNGPSKIQIGSEDSETRLPNLMEGDELIPLTSISAKIAENMQNSLNVPTATSVRSVPVKALEENRIVLNTFLKKRLRRKLSFTHFMAFAIVKALDKFPNLNNTYGMHDGIPVKIQRSSVNLGLAVDTTRRDGTRILLVPSVKNANTMNFAEFADAYDEIIDKARRNKPDPGRPGRRNSFFDEPRHDRHGNVHAAPYGRAGNDHCHWVDRRLPSGVPGYDA